jgi:hypothetical protein
VGGRDVSESFRLAESAAVARRKTGRASRNGLVTSIRVDRRVWRAALDLAGGDAARLVVESATSVTVLNRGRKPA